MKINSAALLTVLALALPAANLLAQDADQPPQPRRPRLQQREDGAPAGPREGAPQDGQRPRGQRPDGQGPDGQKPPTPPIIGALDANNDGVIDEKEIANASAALKKLDKNGDGKLTMEELRPARPVNPQGGAGDNQGGPRPARGQNFRDGGNNRPDGPPPVDGQGQQRRGPRPPQDDKQ